jgi:hypothetical protein
VEKKENGETKDARIKATSTLTKAKPLTPNSPTPNPHRHLLK